MLAGMVFALVSVGSVYVLFHKQDSVSVSVKKKKEGKPYRIALMIPTSHQALTRIVQGFTEHFDSELPLDYTLFNAHGNRVLMKAQAEEVIAHKYDLLCTVGAATSLMAKETIAQRNASLPLVFTAVSEPSKIGLVTAGDTRQMAGVTEEHDYAQQLDWLLFLKPSVKRMLLVYDPTQGSGLQSEYEKIAAVCKQRGIHLDALVISNQREIHQKMTSVLDHHDAILILKDNTVVSGIETVVQICNANGITLFVSDLDSVDKGAALGFGVHEYDFGVEAARKAIDLLTHKKIDAQVTTLTNSYLKVNTQTMKAQNLVLDARHLFLIAKGESL